MPLLNIWICDRCSARFEGGSESEFPTGWWQISAMPTFGEFPDDTDADHATYILCSDCGAEALRQLRDWVRPALPRSN